MLDMTKPESGQPVLLSIIGTQKDDSGEENKIELITEGQVYASDDVSYITYEENLSVDASINDMASVILTVTADKMTLTRSGGVEQIQEFILGRLCVSNYATSDGVFSMGVFTNIFKLERSVDDGALKNINLEYQLEIDGQWQSTNTLSVVIKEENKVGH